MTKSFWSSFVSKIGEGHTFKSFFSSEHITSAASSIHSLINSRSVIGYLHLLIRLNIFMLAKVAFQLLSVGVLIMFCGILLLLIRVTIPAFLASLDLCPYCSMLSVEACFCIAFVHGICDVQTL